MNINGGVWNDLQMCRLWVMFNQRCNAILNQKRFTYNAVMALKDVATTLGVPKFSLHLKQITVLLEKYKRLYLDLSIYQRDRDRLTMFA